MIKGAWKKLNKGLQTLVLVFAAVTPFGGALLYAESSYYKKDEAREQFRNFRLDGLYRDQADCDNIKDLLRRGEKESPLCQRVRQQIKALEEEGKK